MRHLEPQLRGEADMLPGADANGKAQSVPGFGQANRVAGSGRKGQTSYLHVTTQNNNTIKPPSLNP
jgi:hypothetical protein